MCPLHHILHAMCFCSIETWCAVQRGVSAETTMLLLPMACRTMTGEADLAVNVVHSEADLHKLEHDGVLREQLPCSSLYEFIKITILHQCGCNHQYLCLWTPHFHPGNRGTRSSMLPFSVSFLLKQLLTGYAGIAERQEHGACSAWALCAHLAQLHDNFDLGALLSEALMVLDNVGVVQERQDCHLILGLHASFEIASASVRVIKTARC